MLQRGRKSSARFEMGAVQAADAYPEVSIPESLTESQRKLWTGVIALKPSGWMKVDSAPMLEMYCKAVDHYRVMAQRLDGIVPGTREHRSLAKLTQKQMIIVKMLATSLRLTLQSRVTPKTAGRQDRDATVSQPWND